MYFFHRFQISKHTILLPNKNLISRLATCEYISEHRNLFITGATGCGKTYMVCTFGMEACKRYFTTKYIRLSDLLIDLEIARSEGNYRKVLAKYANPLVLILDILIPHPSYQSSYITSYRIFQYFNIFTEFLLVFYRFVNIPNKFFCII